MFPKLDTLCSTATEKNRRVTSHLWGVPNFGKRVFSLHGRPVAEYYYVEATEIVLPTTVEHSGFSLETSIWQTGHVKAPSFGCTPAHSMKNILQGAPQYRPNLFLWVLLGFLATFRAVAPLLWPFDLDHGDGHHALFRGTALLRPCKTVLLPLTMCGVPLLRH